MSQKGAYKNPLSKYIHEYMYWKKVFSDNNSLPNDHYEKLFTTMFHIEKTFYDGKRLLDIGCGPCGSLEWADNALERVGLDPLSEAYQYLGTERHRMSYTPDFAENISFADGYFDIVTSINSLDHVDNLEKSVAEIGRVLGKGGHVLIASEVSREPKPCEPTLVGWDLARHFRGNWRVLDASRFPFAGNVSDSILQGSPLDAGEKTPDSGVLRLILRKDF